MASCQWSGAGHFSLVRPGRRRSAVEHMRDVRLGEGSRMESYNHIKVLWWIMGCANTDS